MPEQSKENGQFAPARSIERTDVFESWIGAWRTGLVYDAFGNGRTAFKASASRYAAQVGMNLVQRIHPFQFTNGTRSWNDNGDRIPQENELGTFSGFPGVTSRYPDENGPDWPYSDEFTAGVEHQLMNDFRVGVMYYHRTNRKVVAQRNVAVPPSAYTEASVAVPGAARRTGRHDHVLQPQPRIPGSGVPGQRVRQSRSCSTRTTTAWSSRPSSGMSDRWQMVAGTHARQELRRRRRAPNELNDPNNSLNFPRGIEGTDSAYAFRLAGSYIAPWEINISGSFIWNDGYPYQSQYAITRTIFPTLTRSSQTIRLTERGDERLPDVKMMDLRVSRSFRFGGRQVTPLFEIFNLGNADTVTGVNNNVGNTYLRPTEILSPRILRLGVSIDF